MKNGRSRNTAKTLCDPASFPPGEFEGFLIRVVERLDASTDAREARLRRKYGDLRKLAKQLRDEASLEDRIDEIYQADGDEPDV